MEIPLPNVSVIIPTYNRASMVIEAVESVLNQTYKDIELIVVDDGSTDNTEDVLRPYFGRITYIKQENRGNAAARNMGLKEAKGELIAFNDSDDLWVEDKLEKEVRYLEEHPDVDMVCGNGIIFGNTKDAGRLVISQSRAESLERKGISIKDIFMKSTIRTPTVVIRKMVIDALGGFDGNLRVCVDGDFSLRLLGGGYKATFINDVFFKLRKHDDNLSADREQRLLHSIKIIKKLLSEKPELEGIIGRENINKRLAYRYYRLAKTYRKKGKVNAAFESITNAISLRPYSLIYRLYKLRFLLNV
jgi:glycosyltransferase involved in cell wall biosynthesis